MTGRIGSPTVSAIAILAALAAAAPAHARVGVTSTTAGEPVGKPVDQAQRVLRVGLDVFANERVTTGANDRAQLLFLDGSSLSVGPNADLTLDKYVYDPAKGTGAIAITAGKGILRLVGGAITKQTEATITTPSGTIGIRGGITIVEIIDQTQTNAYFIFGRNMRGTTDGRSENATRPGSAITLRAGRPPSAPYLANQQALASALGLLEAPFGRQTPGAPPVEQRMAQSQVTQRNSANPNAAPPPQPGPAATTENPPATQVPNAAAQVPVYGTPAPVTHPVVPTGTPLPLQGRLIRDTAFTGFNPATRGAARDPVNNSEVTSALLSGTTLTLTTQAGSTFTLPYLLGSSYNVTGAPSSFGPLNGGSFNGSGDIFLFDLVDSGAQRVMLVGTQQGTVGDFPTTGYGAHVVLTMGNTMPFLPEGSLVTFNGAEASSIFSAYAPVLSPTLPTNQRSVFLQSTLYISGSGFGQSSYFGGVTGVYMQDTSKPDSVYASGGFSGSSRALSGDVITHYVSAIGTMETSTGNVVGQNGGFMAFVPDAIQTDNVGVTTRTTQAAVSSPQSPLATNPYYFLTGAGGTGQPADLGVTRTTRTMNGYAAVILDYHGSSITDDYQRLNMQPGAVTLTTDAATNRASMSMTLQDPGDPATTLTLNMGSLSGNGSDSAFIDDRRIALRQSSLVGSSHTTGAGSGAVTAEIIAVTQAVTPNTQIDGVTPCVCEFLTWGYWTADIKYISGPRTGQTDRAHIGTWVAGDLPTPAQLPTGGTAIYNGHAIGSVVNSGIRYIAAGTFTQTWDFSSRTGTIGINNFDGVNYAGTTAGSPTNVNFAGPITGTGGRAGNVSGSFFKSPTDAAAYQAGTFSIIGTSYKATGTFAGQR